jgi:hypothetical protein
METAPLVEHAIRRCCVNQVDAQVKHVIKQIINNLLIRQLVGTWILDALVASYLERTKSNRAYLKSG